MAALAELAAEQQWLDPTGNELQSAVKGLFDGESGRAVKDALHGVWLGHPLHPVLTDVPIGAWTMAQVFDGLDAASGSDRYADAARVCITTGLVGAVGAAVTGLTDWSETGGKDSRVGLIHGVTNLFATSLFLASAVMIDRPDRVRRFAHRSRVTPWPWRAHILAARLSTSGGSGPITLPTGTPRRSSRGPSAQRILPMARSVR